MALDTAAKRLSALNIGSPWRGVLPVPDGTIDQADRQTVMFLGGAVLAEQAVVVPAPHREALGYGGGGRRRRSARGAPAVTWINVHKESVDDKRKREEERWRRAAEMALDEARLAQIEHEQTVERQDRERERRARLVHETIDVRRRGRVAIDAGTVSVALHEVQRVAAGAVVAVTSEAVDGLYRSPLENLRDERDALRREVARLKKNTKALEILLLAA
jgi:hypothetical protein